MMARNERYREPVKAELGFAFEPATPTRTLQAVYVDGQWD